MVELLFSLWSPNDENAPKAAGSGWADASDVIEAGSGAYQEMTR